ncbi:UNVERIFIED_CONTAM: hypothetical protein FKN15_012780 [Acipenser sinensis]
MGDVAVVIADPQGSRNTVEVMIEDKGSSVYRCTYRPAQPGAHTLDIAFGGEPIPKSPYRVNIGEGETCTYMLQGFSHNHAGSPCTPNACRASGRGLQPKGVRVRQVADFRVDTKNGGSGELKVVVKGPTCTPNACRASGRGLQPKGVRVRQVADFRVDTKNGGSGELKVVVKGPKGLEEPVKQKDFVDGVYSFEYYPHSPGKYVAAITWGGQHIPKSPFEVQVDREAGPQKIRAWGPGLEGGTVGRPADFVVESVGTEVGTLGFAIEGPSQAKIECDDQNDGSCNVSYWPTEVGEYAVHVMCDDEDIEDSPFMALIKPASTTCNPDKVSAYGPGLEKKGCVVNQPGEFTVDAKEAGKAALKIYAQDSEGIPVPVQVKNNGDGTYACSYTPTKAIKHTLAVAWGEGSVPNSPFRRVSGFAIEGPSQAKIECDDQNDGSCNVSYWPTEVGEYAVHVMCDDEDIEDSPFMALIKPASTTCNPDKVSAYGPGLEKKGCVVNQPGEFTVDAKEAGKAALKIYAQDSEGIPVPVQVKNNGDGTYACSYTPTKAIKHTLAVAWGEGSVPNSPFRVSVGKGSHPQRVKVFGPGVERSGLKANEPTHFTVDCTEAGEGVESEKPTHFTVFTKGAGKAPLDVQFSAPLKGEAVRDFEIIDNYDYSHTVKYTPVQQLSVFPAGVESEKPTHFTVFTKGAGKAPLDVQFSAPLKGEAVRDFEIIDNYDYSHTVKYTPVQQGSLGVVVMYGGDSIPRSPFSVGVAAPLDLSRVAVNNLESRVEVGKDQEFSVSTKGAGGQGRLEAVITSPANKAVPCVVEPQPGKDSSLVKYIPKEEGFYSLDLSYDGSPIPGSPFLVEATLPPDPSKVKAYGPGLQGGLVGSPAEFMIDTKGAGTGGLGLTVEGPCEAKIECSDNGDGTCSVSYLPTEQGEYLVNILFQEVHIPGSPFSADVTLPFDPAKVVASGPGLQRGKVGEAGLLRVDCSRAGPGELALEAVSDSGAKAEPHMEDHGDGTYTATYTPLHAGMYTLLLRYGGQAVPTFPARVQVDPAVDTSKVKVYGPGVKGEGVFREATTDFTVDARSLTKVGGDHIKTRITNPSGVQTDCVIKDQTDGTYAAEYTPFESGVHALAVMFDDVPVPGSPFQVGVAEGCDPRRVQAHGPGLQEALTHKPNKFTAVTRGAGIGGLGITVEGPSESKMSCKDNKDGSCSVEYTPYTPGMYDVNITYGGQHVPGVHALAVMFDDVPVPGSPFQVGVAEGCDPRRVQAHGPGLQEALTHKPNKFTVVTRGAGIGGLGITVEGPSESKMSCKDNKDGSCSVEYTPYTPGMYDVNITYGGQHVPGVAEPVEVVHNGDGTHTVAYTPSLEGPYTVSVKYADEEVPRSPFRVKVLPTHDASKVKASGPGLTSGLPASLPVEFTVDARDAGEGQLSVQITVSLGLWLGLGLGLGDVIHN